MTNVKRTKAKLSEEIKRYGTTIENGIKNIPKPHMLFLAKIPYNGFIISLAHLEVTKELSEFYYKRSKYGWWNFCATKDKKDKWDKKILEKEATQYGQYSEAEHDVCNDNQNEGKYFYNLHPNAMLEDMKQQVNLYYRDKEIQIARSKMTAEDYARIEKRAKQFLDNIISQNKDKIKSVDHSTRTAEEMMLRKDGWIVEGKRHSYFVDEDGKAHYWNPKGKMHMQSICIMPRTTNKYIHLYDHVASRILALLNDNQTKKFIHTIE